MQVPIIAPVKQKKFQVKEQEVKTHYKTEFLAGMMGTPALSRNVAVVGHIHHGKTVVRSLVYVALLLEPLILMLPQLSSHLRADEAMGQCR